MIVLDSNVISAFMRSPEPGLVHWLDAQPGQSLWTTSICIYEIEFGIQSLPRGRRRQELHDDFFKMLHIDLGNRVLLFDAAAAKQAAAISADLRKLGRTIDVRDAMIAGTVVARNATLATRNTKHFADTPVAIVNPWELTS